MSRWRKSDYSLSTFLAVLIAKSLLATPANAQTKSEMPAADHGAIGSSFGASLLADLPTSDNLFAVIETMQPMMVSDRFSQGGLYAGQPARLGGFLASFSQTVFRVDGVDITDPTGNGAPLIFPDLAFWERVDVATGLMPGDLNATGLAISLTPFRPGATWSRTVLTSLSHGSLSGGAPDTAAPAIARQDGWSRASVIASGPLSDRMGAVFGGTWTSGAQFHRSEAASVDAQAGSFFTQLVSKLGPANEWRLLGGVHYSTAPFDLRVPFGQLDAQARDTSFHLQTTVDVRESPARAISIFGAYTQRGRDSDASASVFPAAIDRVTEGSPMAFASPLDYTVSRWSAGLRLRPQPDRSARHAPSFGVDVGGSAANADSFFNGVVAESVGGVPARVWTFTSPGTSSQRSALTLAVDAGETLRLSSAVTVDASIRFDAVSGSAEGSDDTISWSNWLPKTSVRWAITDRWQMSALAGYSRSAYRLPLDVLAIGDPAAPTAAIYTGDIRTLSLLAPVARVGPGTGGDPEFSRIDPDLKRPVSDELVLGFQAKPHPTLRLSFVGVARRESHLMGLVNVGAPASAYDTLGIEDGGLYGEPSILPVYNRRPESFGLDRYLLTTPAQDAATFKGFEIGFTWNTTRVLVEGGLTAGISDIPAASRGFRADENDQGLPGEVWSNPNAATFSRTRPFNDRAYTGKLASVVRFPSEIRLGVIARYLDGQPFSRIVVVDDLNQGAEGVRAYADGGTRFTFIGTLDMRLQKGFTVGGTRLDAFLDIYNLPNMSLEVEEDVVTGPTFREISAVQPPRSFHVGVRWAF